MEKIPVVIYTNHPINKLVSAAFAKGFKGKLVHVTNFNDFGLPIAAYGILRGTGAIIKRINDFWYIDHGYFKSSKRSFKSRTLIHNLDGYFRVVHNNFWHIGKGPCKKDRWKKLNIDFEPLRKNGKYIILSEPSQHIIDFFQLGDWTNNTINKIRKFSDRKIVIHNKKSKVDLNILLKQAWAFVSEQSTAGIKAMIQGVPAHFTNNTLKIINSIEEIEDGKIDYNIFYNLAYGQWTLKEMESGEAWDFLKKDLII